MHFQKNKFDFVAGEILNINKPEGWTSFDVVNKIRKIIGIRKVGHSGTLDPFATGVLLICTGGATKRVQELMELTKEYIGEIQFGVTTDTLDETGRIIDRKPIDSLNLEDVTRVCKQFIGEIDQVPPMYSARKVNGVRLYKLARKGQKIEVNPRRIRIQSLEILSFNSPKLKIEVVCSKGTYIRALARDIGKALTCGGYLKTLCRTKIGNYSIKDAWSIQAFQEYITNSEIIRQSERNGN